MKKIHVGFLLSYDYEKLKLSIPSVYRSADRIFIAEDINKNTWTGNKFSVDEEFYKWLEKFDTDNKIEIYRDNFYIPHLTGIQNDTRERHLLSQKMGIGNWLIQVDSDEYFLDFDSFVTQLRKYDSYLDNPKKTPIQISGFHVDIYKYLDEGLLYVKDTCKVLVATNYPNYKLARQSRERVIYVNSLIFHESLARTEKELEFKLKNWGHSHELNDEFMSKWKKANKDNYNEIKDVFYLNPKQWSSIGYIKTKNIDELKNHLNEIEIQKITAFFIFSKNFGQWFKHLFKKKKSAEFEKYF
ncbi:hypothetical protein [Flavobacterium aestuarii]|uniref:hypothetical protein n=1 Tax=Flavobacterium aestuarii TaxID=3149227 RepID=UPI0032B52557